MGRLQLRMETLEDRSVPSTTAGVFAVGSDVGGDPTVKVFSSTGSLISQRVVFESGFRGGVKAVMADVNGDTVPDLIAAAGRGGGPHIRVFDGKTDVELMSFYAYSKDFIGGVNVGAGDFDGDGKAEIVAGAGNGGGPHVRVFRADTSVFLELMAYDPGLGIGIHVAAGDLNGDGRAELITGAPAGGGPHVRSFDASGKDVGGFFAYAQSFSGGVHVAAGDLNGDGKAEIVTGPGTTGGPHIRIFDQFGTDRGGYFADVSQMSYGSPVAVTTPDSKGKAVIVSGHGPGGDGGIVGYNMNGSFAFERQAFLNTEGITFGSGSGFSVSHTEVLAANAEAERLAMEDHYDFQEVLDYIWEDSDEIDDDATVNALTAWNILKWWG
jgi:hypothetical protein